jgi:hypothetical protein
MAQWTALALLAGLTFAAPPAPAAVTEAWVQRYNNPSGGVEDRAFKVVRDPADNFIVIGSTDGNGGSRC